MPFGIDIWTPATEPKAPTEHWDASEQARAKDHDANLEEYIRWSGKMAQLTPVLGRPPATHSRSVSGKVAIRGEELYRRLWKGDLLPGEALEIASGGRDDELNIPEGEAGEKRVARAQGLCYDCGKDITDPSTRLRSDMRRCKDCTRARRRGYNQRYRGTN